MMDEQMARLQAMGELETVRTDIQGLAGTLGGISLWRPAVGMKKACDEALLMLDRLVERFDRKLVVTIVGPCGAGKSRPSVHEGATPRVAMVSRPAANQLR